MAKRNNDRHVYIPCYIVPLVEQDAKNKNIKRLSENIKELVGAVETNPIIGVASMKVSWGIVSPLWDLNNATKKPINDIKDEYIVELVTSFIQGLIKEKQYASTRA